MVGIQVRTYSPQQLEDAEVHFRPSWNPSEEIPLVSREQDEFLELCAKKNSEHKFLDPWDMEKWAVQMGVTTKGTMPMPP